MSLPCFHCFPFLRKQVWQNRPDASVDEEKAKAANDQSQKGTDKHPSCEGSSVGRTSVVAEVSPRVDKEEAQAGKEQSDVATNKALVCKEAGSEKEMDKEDTKASQGADAATGGQEHDVFKVPHLPAKRKVSEKRNDKVAAAKNDKDKRKRHDAPLVPLARGAPKRKRIIRKY